MLIYSLAQDEKRLTETKLAQEQSLSFQQQNQLVQLRQDKMAAEAGTVQLRQKVKIRQTVAKNPVFIKIHKKSCECSFLPLLSQFQRYHDDDDIKNDDDDDDYVPPGPVEPVPAVPGPHFHAGAG